VIAPDTVVAGRYKLIECLGAGGMGEVWKAHDTNFTRIVEVAVKLLREDETSADDARARSRFVRSMGAAAKAERVTVEWLIATLDAAFNVGAKKGDLERLARSRLGDGEVTLANATAFFDSVADDTNFNENARLRHSLRRRFADEANAVATLNHPNIVRVTDFGDENGVPFLVMDFVNGRTLNHVIQHRESMDVAYRLQLIEDLCQALSYAHARGVIHRDIKPANLIIDTETRRLKILDFGVARFWSSGSSTAVGVPIGTLSYMSPEQILGASQIDGRSDIFSAGVVLYELLTFARAFPPSDSLPNLIRRIQREAPVPLHELVPNLPDGIGSIVTRALEKDPAHRFQDAAQMGRELELVRTRLEKEKTAPGLPVSALPHDEDDVRQSTQPAPSDGTVVGGVLTQWPSNLGERTSGVDAPESSASLRSSSATMPLAAGSRVGKFTVHELIARGRTGHLYKAFDPVRSRLIGLKVIHNPSGITVERLLRASRIWLDLNHPNLQTILEVDPGDTSGTAIIATELVEGVDLGRVMRSRRLELIQKIEVAIQICEALEYLHTRGVVHREITPKNIVLSQHNLRVTLLDSGLARSTDTNEPQLTVAGAAVGDARYMAPEQLTGRSDQRSDIYSLGVILGEMLLDDDFQPSRRAAWRERIGNVETLPRKLVDTLLIALQEEPGRRFASVREFSDCLQSLVPQKLAPLNIAQAVVTLHGIRTHAKWQRAFSEVASRAGWHCCLDRWNFGYFSVFRLVVPWSRLAKVRWFRETYHDEFGEQATSPLTIERPSIVAHSFGTYILGNALMRYPYLRFNRVLLCGSILPEDFPWDLLIDRGQVQAVRNEYGARDVWTRIARIGVRGTGPSGLVGFSCKHERLEQEMFDFSHSEYFEKGHMEQKWLPFLKRRLTYITPRERSSVPPPG
jgi:serine/threonine protein kinase